MIRWEIAGEIVSEVRRNRFDGSETAPLGVGITTRRGVVGVPSALWDRGAVAGVANRVWVASVEAGRPSMLQDEIAEAMTRVAIVTPKRARVHRIVPLWRVGGYSVWIGSCTV